MLNALFAWAWRRGVGWTMGGGVGLAGTGAFDLAPCPRLPGVSHLAQSISGRSSNGDLNGKYHSKTNVVFRILNFHRQPFNFLTRKFPIKRELFFSLDIYKHQ